MSPYTLEAAKSALFGWPVAVGTIPNGLLRYKITHLVSNGYWLLDARQHEPYLLPIFESKEYRTQVFFAGEWLNWSRIITISGSAWDLVGQSNLRNVLSSPPVKAYFVRLKVPPSTPECPEPYPFDTVQCPRCPDGPGTGTNGLELCGQCGGSSRILQTSYPVDITEEEAMDIEKLFETANAPEHKAIRDLAAECRTVADIAVASRDLSQELLGGDYTPEVAEKVEQALIAGKTSTGVDLPLTPEIDKAITEALKPRKAFIGNFVGSVVTTDEIAEEFNERFRPQMSRNIPGVVCLEATEHFKGRRVVVAPEGIWGYETCDSATIERVEFYEETGVCLILKTIGDHLVFGVNLPEEPPMALSVFLSYLDAIHHPDDLAVFLGSFPKVRIPYSIKLSDGSIIQAGAIATCRSINFAVDQKSPAYTISFEAPSGDFTHYALRPESSKALPGHQRKTRTMTTQFTKTQVRSIIKDYVGGAGLYAIGTEFGVSAATVKRVLTQNDVTIRAQGRPINAAAAYQAGTGLGALSAKTGIPVKRLRASIAAKGVKIRGVGRPKKSM